jgi:hypothetical protein
MMHEAHLRLLTANGAVRRFTIQQTGCGKFQLRVLPADGKETVLTSSRGQPRQWARLNTLVSHLRTQYAAVPHIELALHTP